MVDKRTHLGVMQLTIVGVNAVSGVGANAARASQQSPLTVTHKAHNRSQAMQNILQEGTARTRAGATTHLFMVKGHKHRSIIFRTRQVLQGNQASVNTREVV